MWNGASGGNPLGLCAEVFAGTTTDNGSQQVEEPQAPIRAFPIQSFDLVRFDIMIRTATTQVFSNHGSDEA
jgi:hypothetical protein